MKKSQLEIACFGLNAVVLAQKNGADRIELCQNKEVGGVTPDYQLVADTRKIATAQLYVMVRPRGGNFVYNDEEFKCMKQNILDLKKYNVDGFVFGILNADNTINIEQNKELVALASPLRCTFHRAFDDIPEESLGLQQLIKIGFAHVLTSGKAENAILGLTVLEKLIAEANDKIAIITGGSVRSTNIDILLQKLGSQIYHSSAVLDETDIPSEVEIQKLKKALS